MLEAAEAVIHSELLSPIFLKGDQIVRVVGSFMCFYSE